jgi:HEAT repeat protein
LNDEHTSTAATYALGRIGRIPFEAESIVRGNASGKDKTLSTVSLWALAHTRPDDKRLLAQVTEQLIARLNDEDPNVRVAAARGLAALPPAPEITLPIWEKAIQSADETTVHHALDALARLRAPAVPLLVNALKHENLRPQVLQVLQHMGPAAAAATGTLVGLIDDPDEHVVRSAVMAIAAIGPDAKEAVPALVKALQQRDRPDSHTIIYALGRIGPGAAEAKSSLLELLGGSNADLALISAWAVTKIDPSPATAARAVPVLVSGLGSPVVIMRRGAAEALGDMGPAAKSAVAALERAQKDNDKSVRDAAIAALAAVRR